jgi:dolichol-phosphate mannosyltransferase
MSGLVSIVVPMFNEAANVETMVQEVSAALDGQAFELIIVDDASSDDTVERVRFAMATDTHLRLVSNARRRGQSTAIWNGVQAARGDWIVILDGDLQNDPADIPQFLMRMESSGKRETGVAPLGLLIGNRVNRHDSLIRRLSSRVANGVRRSVLRDSTPDTGCGLKLISRSLFMQLPYFDHMHRFMPALVQQLGCRVESVPVRHRPRRAGHSKYGVFDRLWVGVVDLFGVAWLARRNRRIDWSEPMSGSRGGQ